MNRTISPPSRAAAMTPDLLMDWAEGAYPSYFPGHKTSQTADPYVYRHYPETGNYLGVNGVAVYVMGTDFGAEPLYVGKLDDYRCGVDASACTVAPASAAEAARFLAQAAPGATHAEISALLAGTYGEWIDAQLAAPRGQSHWDWLRAKGYAAEDYRNNAQGLDNTIWRALIGGADPLRQRMTLALSEILVVSVLGVSTLWRQFAMANYLDILEEHAFGNYRELLEKLTLSSAMGIYLTYRGNAKANAATGSQPDENYARELMQLFSIGLIRLNQDGTPELRDGAPVETYTQDDVTGLARVFTGWEIDIAGFATPLPPDPHRRPLTQMPNRYETGAKSFLGVAIPAGTPADTALGIALDTLFNHPNVPPFVGKQLIQRLVTSNPGPAYVARVAAVFADNGAGVRGDLAATLRAILLDVEARDPLYGNASGGKLREPVLRFLNWARAFSAVSPADAWDVGDLSDPATRLGQSPLRAPSVFNFFRPGYVPPNTAIAAQGLVGPEFQLVNETTVAGYLNFAQNFVAGKRVGDLAPDYAGLTVLAGDSAALLDELNLVLAAGQLSPATLDLLKPALDSIAADGESGKTKRVQAAILLVMAAPEYLVQK